MQASTFKTKCKTHNKGNKKKTTKRGENFCEKKKNRTECGAIDSLITSSLLTTELSRSEPSPDNSPRKGIFKTVCQMSLKSHWSSFIKEVLLQYIPLKKFR